MNVLTPAATTRFLIAVAFLLSSTFAYGSDNVDPAVSECIANWDQIADNKPLLMARLCDIPVLKQGSVSVFITQLAMPRSKFLTSTLSNYSYLYSRSPFLMEPTSVDALFRLAKFGDEDELLYEIDGVTSYAFLSDTNAYWVRCAPTTEECRFYFDVISANYEDEYGVDRYCETFLTFGFWPDTAAALSHYMTTALMVSRSILALSHSDLLKTCK